MQLIIKLREDSISALRVKDDVRKNLLRTLIGDCCKETKEPDDAKCVSIIKSFLKTINEKVFPELEEHTTHWDKVITEREILESYLPKQLTEKEIKTIIANLVVATESLQLKDVMVFFKKNFEGQYDGGLVSKITKEILNG